MTISAESLTGREGDAFDIDGKPFQLIALVRHDDPSGGALIARFESADVHGLGQRTRTVVHGELGSGELFLVPSGPRELCATFTWLTPTA